MLNDVKVGEEKVEFFSPLEAGNDTSETASLR